MKMNASRRMRSISCRFETRFQDPNRPKHSSLRHLRNPLCIETSSSIQIQLRDGTNRPGAPVIPSRTNCAHRNSWWAQLYFRVELRCLLSVIFSVRQVRTLHIDTNRVFQYDRTVECRVGVIDIHSCRRRAACDLQQFVENQRVSDGVGSKVSDGRCAGQ
jgi:hypothetical protein